MTEQRLPASLFKSFAQTAKRSHAAVVPEPYRFLFQPARYKICFGGRGAGRSWSIARALVLRAHDRPTRILCAREIQASIGESVHRLLSDQIALLGFSDFFEIQAYAILGKNGSEFFFEGLRSNVSKIKSAEGIDVVWVEEAEAVTEHSWSTLIPTIRKPNSEIWLSFNPLLASDPTYKRFVTSPPPNAKVKHTTFRDNPYLPQVLEDERAYLQSVDDDAYRWIWLGECRTVSDALILKGKFFVEPFEVDPSWSGPHHGLDFGFSRDPNAAVRLYIDDVNKVLYVKSEYWALGTDIDALPAALEAAIPGISQHTVFCDNSRPESISYLSRHGIANARPADKWAGSVDDGIAYLRSFQRIVIDPACKHFLDECRTYCFKCDRLTGSPLPEPEDRCNHLIDSARYALSPLIRNLPMSGFFSRSALLVKGHPVEEVSGAKDVYGVLVATDRTGTAAGLMIFATSHNDEPQRLIVCDYLLAEVDEAVSIPWLKVAYQQVQAFAQQFRAFNTPEILVEQDDFGQAVFNAAVDHFEQYNDVIGIRLMQRSRLDPPPQPLDDRAAAIRSTVNASQFVKLSRVAFEHQLIHRNTSTNHLLSQILGYRPGARDAPRELVAAFCIGVGVWTGAEKWY